MRNALALFLDRTKFETVKTVIGKHLKRALDTKFNNTLPTPESIPRLQ